MADVVHLPEPVPEGWAPSKVFADEWTRPFGPPDDVPARVGEVRGYLWVGPDVEHPDMLSGAVVVDGRRDLVSFAMHPAASGVYSVSLREACAAVEIAFCGCRAVAAYPDALLEDAATLRRGRAVVNLR